MTEKERIRFAVLSANFLPISKTLRRGKRIEFLIPKIGTFVIGDKPIKKKKKTAKTSKTQYKRKHSRNQTRKKNATKFKSIQDFF